MTMQETPKFISQDREYPTPIATVDIALFTLKEDILHVLLVKRTQGPFANEYALPGGFIHLDEDMDATSTARRVLRDKVGIKEGYFLEQLYTFSGRVRDPRGWSVSVGYYAVVPEYVLPENVVGKFVPVDNLPDLPFDHTRILEKALERLRSKSSYSSLPAFLLTNSFTLTQLHEVYEHVIGTRLDKASFRRKIEDQGIIEPIPGEMVRGGAHRPSQLYKLTANTLSEFNKTI